MVAAAEAFNTPRRPAMSEDPRIVRLVESDRVDECFDCGRVKKVYAMQKVAFLNDRTGVRRIEVKPLCRQCYRLHDKADRDAAEGKV
jgi:hypothetical protein